MGDEARLRLKLAQLSEVHRVDLTVEVEIALAPDLAAGVVTEVRGQGVEVQRVHDPVEIGVASVGVTNKNRRRRYRLPVECIEAQ